MRAFSFLALVGLAACSGGSTDSNTGTHVTETDPCDCSAPEHADFDEDGDGVCDIAECEEDTGPTGGTGTFTAPAVDVVGSSESCTSNLVGDAKTYSVPSGNTVDVEGDTYDVTYGDLSLASESSDWLPVHTATDGSTWLAPSQLVPIADGDTVTPEAPVMSRYIGGETWTCNDAGSTDESTAQTLESYYMDEATHLLLGLNGTKMVIEGETLSPTEDCESLDGTFLNSTQITYHAACGPGDNFDIECWAGTFEDRPTVW